MFGYPGYVLGWVTGRRTTADGAVRAPRLGVVVSRCWPGRGLEPVTDARVSPDRSNPCARVVRGTARLDHAGAANENFRGPKTATSASRVEASVTSAHHGPASALEGASSSTRPALAPTPPAPGMTAPTRAPARLSAMATADIERLVVHGIRRRIDASAGAERHAAGEDLLLLLTEWQRRGSCPRPVGRLST